MIKDADRRKLYFVWYSMLRRCNNPNHKSYQYYGGKGISVCSDWNVNVPQGTRETIKDL